MDRALNERLSQYMPDTLDDWVQVLVDVLSDMPVDQLTRVVRSQPFASTRVADAWADDPETRAAGWNALRLILHAWLSGDPVADISVLAHEAGGADGPGRGARDPLPRTLRLIQNGLEFELAGAAGAIVALVEQRASQGASASPGLTPASILELARLPLAIRFGLGDPAILALNRAGARPRAAARILARLVDTPADMTEGEIGTWARGVMARLRELVREADLPSDDQELLQALLAARRAA